VRGTDESDRDDAWVGRAIVPGVARAVLNDTIAGFEEEFGAVVEFQINLAGKDDVEIHGVGGVHAGVHWFEDFGHAGEFGLEFGEGGGEIGLLGDGLGARRYGEKAETEAARGREVAWMRRRSAVAGERRGRIGAPQAMEFEAGEQGESDGRDCGVFGENGFAGGVAAGDDAANVHGRVLQVSRKRRDCTFSALIGEERIRITQRSPDQVGVNAGRREEKKEERGTKAERRKKERPVRRGRRGLTWIGAVLKIGAI
jgi:hypothetical protein